MRARRRNDGSHGAGSSATTSAASPNAQPGRGVYGFALYLFAWICFLLYLMWALLPQWLLTSLHLTYLPSKYWAIVLPLIIPTGLCVYVTICFSLYLIRFEGALDVCAESDRLENDFLDS